MTFQATDRHRATAERNVQAILDAAEQLLDRSAAVSIAAVAAQAGVSRVTVYAHFPSWEALLEAVVQRAVERGMAAITAADLASGPAPAALGRLLAAGWRELARNAAIAEAAARQLNGAAMTRSHQAAHQMVAELIDRGRDDGAFRTDVPTGWLVTSIFALLHAAADEVRAGRLDRASAERLLAGTVRDLLTAGDLRALA
jgi:AcrR family transcriptional regulator